MVCSFLHAYQPRVFFAIDNNTDMKIDTATGKDQQHGTAIQCFSINKKNTAITAIKYQATEKTKTIATSRTLLRRYGMF